MGCFVSVTEGGYQDTEEQKNTAIEQGKYFRDYVWGENGLDCKLGDLPFHIYGKDLELVLFQFYVNPMKMELDTLPSIEKYRKKEKAIGIPIIINHDNFFSKSQEEKEQFLKKSILDKISHELQQVIVSKNLDTNVEQLLLDITKILS